MVSPNMYDNHQLCFASEKAFAVFTIDVEQGQMQAIGIIANPEKLARIRREEGTILSSFQDILSIAKKPGRKLGILSQSRGECR